MGIRKNAKFLKNRINQFWKRDKIVTPILLCGMASYQKDIFIVKQKKAGFKSVDLQKHPWKKSIDA